MPALCDGYRTCAGKRGVSPWQAVPWILFCGCGGDFLWTAENENHLYLVFLVRYHGRACGQHPRPWLCGDADDSFSLRRLRIPSGLDLHLFCLGQDAADSLYILPHILGADSRGSPDLLYCGVPENESKKLIA